MLLGGLCCRLRRCFIRRKIHSAKNPATATKMRYSTKSKTASTLMVLMMTVIVLISISNCFASVSRLVWAFARDGGIPFSGYFTYVCNTPT